MRITLGVDPHPLDDPNTKDPISHTSETLAIDAEMSRLQTPEHSVEVVDEPGDVLVYLASGVIIGFDLRFGSFFFELGVGTLELFVALLEEIVEFSIERSAISAYCWVVVSCHVLEHTGQALL